MAPWLITMASCAASASNLLGALVKGMRGDLGDARGDLLGEALGRIEAGADGRAALRQLHQVGQRRFDALDAVRHLRRVAGELLAERERRRVLRMRAADLDDVRPRLRLGVERLVQVAQGRQQAMMDLLRAGDVHGRRIGIVRRLAHVDVVVGMHRLLGAHHAAQHLDRAVRDHLVGVHVGLRAGAGLPHHQREMLVELAVDHFLGGRDDGLAELRGRAGRAPRSPRPPRA